jgi:hypothetical protein
VVLQPAAELVELPAAAEAKLNEPGAEAPRPSSASTQDFLLAVALLALPVEAVEQASQPELAAQVESAVELRAELVAHLTLSRTPPPQFCRDRNSVSTVGAARAK